MIKTNELPNITGFQKTDGFVVDASSGTGRLTGNEAAEFMKEYFLQGGVPYGKELTESWASLNGRIRAGDFTGLHIGDYKTITLTTGEVVIMELAGVDQYYECGDSKIGHHADFISRDCLAGGRRMNEANNNNGTEAEKNPWLASELYQVLNDETTGIYAKLPSDLKPYIITKRALLEERYSSAGSVAADTGWAWKNMGKLWLPTEVEVFGHHTWSEPGYGTGGGGCNLQYPIFAGGAKHIIKGDGNGGSRCTWWEASAYRTSAATFCYVAYYGGAYGHDASNAGIRAPLCFRIG
ncbi:MAG: hypothetical protein IJL89_02740 [Firmicutes bacterium]|nr:hypothetical protein [Bacillota bacterium]